MQKLKPALFFCLVILCSATLKTGNDEKIRWLNMPEVAAKLKQENRPVLIDLFTDWCYWCKEMDRKTYTNAKVIAYINEHFYSAKVNAETKENVAWKDKIYTYNNKYRINEFALFLSYGRASFPTTVIIANDASAPIPISGYMDAKELEPILKYFGEGAYKTMNFPQFEKSFKASW